MLKVTDFSRSDPDERDILTISLSPRLASQAPIVSKIIANIVDEYMFASVIELGMISTRDSIIPSRHSRDMSKWVRWIINAVKAKINAIWKNITSVID